MKDHEKRELVNRLTALALEFADTQQLRARIAGEVLPAITAAEAAERERCAKLREPLAPEAIEAAAAEAFGYEGGLQEVNLGDLLHFARVLEQRHGIGA